MFSNTVILKCDPVNGEPLREVCTNDFKFFFGSTQISFSKTSCKNESEIGIKIAKILNNHRFIQVSFLKLLCKCLFF